MGAYVEYWTFLLNIFFILNINLFNKFNYFKFRNTVFLFFYTFLCGIEKLENMPAGVGFTPIQGYQDHIEILVSTKVGCVFPMVVVSILPHAEFGPNDHREDAPHFSMD